MAGHSYFGEHNKEGAKNRPAPNLSFSLYEDETRIGISYQNLPSIKLFKNIAHEFHDSDRSELIGHLRNLDDDFETTVYRMIKEHHFAEEPEYEQEYSFITNTIDEVKLEKVISLSDEIRVEGRERRLAEGKSWTPVILGIDLANIRLEKDEDSFRRVLRQIKPIYQIVLNIYTSQEINQKLSEELERKIRAKEIEARSYYRCSTCAKEYTQVEYDNIQFCTSCGTSRARWTRGDQLFTPN